MPLFRINGHLHYFAHVPKCAGTSVESYLKDRFGQLGFVDMQYMQKPEPQRWTRSSPQHADWQSVTRLVPPDWIRSSFGVVRHPVSRLRSDYEYQRLYERTVPEGMDINDWFRDWVDGREETPFRYDNHLRPASELIPEHATVFRLEDGLQPIVAYLDELAGNQDGPRDLAHQNKSQGGDNYAAGQTPLSDETLDLIARVYARDFERFGYACKDTIGDGPARPLPSPKKPLLKRLFRRG
ncbi:sulfotransferase family 2 domain-containing protein [Roseovarius amoyensis]|uniref:sulfotransferase family 2 domain-containing protein n=1 Tax=Roseovarius amoyensis TaxID=2211448 RepID=UPI000DBE1D00|nr:sulfotransferase family 2 domain-containing protein [Roseovarius amoyensis]